MGQLTRPSALATTVITGNWAIVSFVKKLSLLAIGSTGMTLSSVTKCHHWQMVIGSAGVTVSYDWQWGELGRLPAMSINCHHWQLGQLKRLLALLITGIWVSWSDCQLCQQLSSHVIWSAVTALSTWATRPAGTTLLTQILPGHVHLHLTTHTI